MALADKMAHLAERVKSIPQVLENSVDTQLARLDRVEVRGAEAMKRMQTYVDGVESGVTAVEDTLNQVSNFPPV